jgi:uncharacterized protein YndB with AHSA1/START domain
VAWIERELLLDAPPDEVWRAISDEAMLREWLAPQLELDLREGGALRCRTEDGEERLGSVELVADGELLAFRWLRHGAEPSRVELRIEELEVGTRLTVTESGLRASTVEQASDGWRQRLDALRTALARLAYA